MEVVAAGDQVGRLGGERGLGGGEGVRELDAGAELLLEQPREPGAEQALLVADEHAPLLVVLERAQRGEQLVAAGGDGAGGVAGGRRVAVPEHGERADGPLGAGEWEAERAAQPERDGDAVERVAAALGRDVVERPSLASSTTSEADSGSRARVASKGRPLDATTSKLWRSKRTSVSASAASSARSAASLPGSRGSCSAPASPSSAGVRLDDRKPRSLPLARCATPGR